MALASRATAVQLEADLACKGMSPIYDACNYNSYDDFWVMPVCHTALYGVVKDFWKCILGASAMAAPRHPNFQIRKAGRDLIAQRYREVNLTSEFSSPPRCISKICFCQSRQLQHRAHHFSCRSSISPSPQKYHRPEGVLHHGGLAAFHAWLLRVLSARGLPWPDHDAGRAQRLDSPAEVYWPCLHFHAQQR